MKQQVGALILRIALGLVFAGSVFCNRKVQKNAIKNAEDCHPFNSFLTMHETVYNFHRGKI